ncbi:MAG: type II secretion system secretin GspD [Deltaproteobacteria bacterium]|nr:MAG: type II secretion system secretin GspD [Deltaproteobacteria bacterium]
MTMRFKTKIKFITCSLSIGLILLTNSSLGTGARLAGEEDVTPVTPEPRQAAERPAQVKPAVIEKQPQAEKKVLPKKEITQEKKVPKGQGPDKRYVTIDFDDVDIGIFIKFISELTGKNFVVDKGVRGKVTIISPTKISVKEAYKVFESVLEVHGFTTVPAGNIIKIVPALQARSKSVETRLREEAITPEDKVVTQLIPLEYANPEELKKLFAPLISKSSVIASYPPTRMLIVTDVLSNIKRLLRIVREIDVVGIGEEISVIPLAHATASDLSRSLGDIFQRQVTRPKKGEPISPAMRIVPDERTNSLIILATEDDTFRIKELIKLLDKEIPRGEGDVHVYYLQNANAEDLVKVLTALPSKEEGEAKKGKAPVISKEVHIVADKATNSLIIQAKKHDYLVLEDIIKKLDIPRRMVYLEALIMEVNVDKDFRLGAEWHAVEEIGSHEGRAIGAFGGSTVGEGISPTIDATGTARLPLGFSLGVLGDSITIGNITFPSIWAVLRAYQKDSDVNIISTPQILTTDNEEAEIMVGENVPYLTREEITGVTEREYATYEYKDVGTTLKITPQISQERFVRLKIFQELIKLKAGTTEFKPTTLKRSAETTVIVKDKNTVVIGGIIGESTERGTYKVPCLGDVPGLGWLFRSISRVRNKTNLFVFLTPHIIENPMEAEEIYKEKKEEMERIGGGAIKMYKKPELTDQDLSVK